jgi:hypothetical protein
MVKNIVKILLNIEVYPTNEQFRQTTEEFLSENHQDFFKKFKKRDKWISYYESNFYPQVSLNQFYKHFNILLKLLDCLN